MMLNLEANSEFIVMEKYGSSLYTLVSKCSGFPFTKPEVLAMGIQLIQNIEKLHKIGYIHGDIKPDNILLAAGDKVAGECVSKRCNRINKHIFCNYSD